MRFRKFRVGFLYRRRGRFPQVDFGVAEPVLVKQSLQLCVQLCRFGVRFVPRMFPCCSAGRCSRSEDSRPHPHVRCLPNKLQQHRRAAPGTADHVPSALALIGRNTSTSQLLVGKGPNNSPTLKGYTGNSSLGLIRLTEAILSSIHATASARWRIGTQPYTHRPRAASN